MMNKIMMKTPLVEMDGDEMTRVIWKEIKDKLICPFVEYKSVYFDLGLPNRDLTDDEVTVEAAKAAREYGVSVKCATITPNNQRKEEYNLKRLYKSPNATIRAIMDGTVFREPIVVDGIKPYVRTWKKPITVARHAYGDIYKAVEIKSENAGKCELVFTDLNGKRQTETVFENSGPAIFQGMHNSEQSIVLFANSCFKYAISTRQNLLFGAKDTISKVYDGEFKAIFEREFLKYKDVFDSLGITYMYTLIDDAIARVIRSEGGFIWACKNYDGDVMSDMVATAFGSLSMMKSVLVTPDGKFEYEAAHGTVTRHYYRYLKGETPSTNPIATIFAFSGALRKRGELDGLNDLVKFADNIEKTVYEALDLGYMTKDLAILARESKNNIKEVNLFEFIDIISKKLAALY